MTPPSITLQHLTVGYGEEIVLRSMNLTLLGPGLIQVLGPNGAGKSTLLRTIAGLLRPIEGRVLISGVDVTGNPRKAGRYIGYVPQLSAEPGAKFPVTVWELVESSLTLYRKKWPRIAVKDHERRLVEETLKKVGLPPSLWHKNVWELSGGQRQRTLIARALVHDPPILVLDEPLAAVDPAGRSEIAKLIESVSRNKLVVVTSHDPSFMITFTKLVVLLNRSFYVVGSPSEVLTDENIRKVYGRPAMLKTPLH